ncbi:NAD(P)H-dependent oxidoreductase [Bradyrhizobium sp.]|uniref:NAD(P)H-dependent oxidoreductase n=1 Tax=Bradyrhizobium sp. TaxID=376 RepID=UPI002D3ACCEF|nr:NAD(P)H-dependent oxidoreductase [Bradyrhizobium sp.]HZR72690.1 NAD(P)H-dependent oxidoreductase [Bradyrhizobium sp.]
MKSPLTSIGGINVLVVYAHPEPTSFGAGLKDAAVKSLTAAGHSVEISDLYAEGFNPVAGRHDFKSPSDPARFHYQSEQLHASQSDGFAADLVREQDRLMRADLVVFIFPLWWGGLPAIVKGWFDRVCAYGVAYADGKRYERGYFVGHRALLALTTGGTAERFSQGSYGEMSHVLHSVQRCILEYLGFEALKPFVAYAAPRVDAGVRVQYLREFETRLLEAADDPQWRQRLRASDRLVAENRRPVDDKAWAAPR